MLALLIIGGVLTASGVGLAAAAGKAKARGPIDARTKMSPPELLKLLETQLKGVVREATAARETCSKAANYEACMRDPNNRFMRLVRAAAGTTAMLGTMPVFALALQQMAAGMDDDAVMGPVVESGEVWPGTSIPIVQYLESLR